MPWIRLALVIAAFVFGGGTLPLPFRDKPAPVQPSPDKPVTPRRPLVPRPWRPAPVGEPDCVSGCKCVKCDCGPVCDCMDEARKSKPIEDAKVGGQTSPDGSEENACDLPREYQLKNVGGTDGAGLCVFASGQHSATWQRVEAYDGVFKYMQTQRGGGWPDKVDQVVTTMAKRTGMPSPSYIQVESKDPLAILKLACKTGRMPGVTYSFSPTGRYNGQKIAHMVSLVHASEKWFGVLDNNYPGSIEWMDPATFLKVHTNNGRELGWSVIFLADPPPPVPTN